MLCGVSPESISVANAAYAFAPAESGAYLLIGWPCDGASASLTLRGITT